MGIGVVLIFYAIALTIAALVGAVILGSAAYLFTRHAVTGRKRATAASVLFPFCYVGYAGVCFVAYTLINEVVSDRDPGLGDSWETPLPNGYALMMIDVTDEGTVYNPKTQTYRGSITSRDDAVFGVRQLQVSNTLIFGARDTGYFARIGRDSKIVDSYFELDTKNKTHIEFKSLEELKDRASNRGVSLNLREFQSVFGDYRTTWFDYLTVLILFLGPAVGFLILAWYVLSVRRKRGVISDEWKRGAAQSF